MLSIPRTWRRNAMIIDLLFAYLVIVDSVERWSFLVVNVYLVRLHSTSDAHHTQVVLELEPAFSTPDEVHVRRHQIRHQDFTDRLLQVTAVAGWHRVKEVFL